MARQSTAIFGGGMLGRLAVLLAVLLVAVPTSAARRRLFNHGTCTSVALKSTTCDSPQTTGYTPSPCSGNLQQKCNTISATAGATFCFASSVDRINLFVKDKNCPVGGFTTDPNCPFVPTNTPPPLALTADTCNNGAGQTQYGCLVQYKLVGGEWVVDPDHTDCAVQPGVAGWSATGSAQESFLDCLDITSAVDANGWTCVSVKLGNCKSPGGSISHVAIGDGQKCCSCTIDSFPTSVCKGATLTTASVKQTCAGTAPDGTSVDAVVGAAVTATATPAVTFDSCAAKDVTWKVTDACGTVQTKTQSTTVKGSSNIKWYTDSARTTEYTGTVKASDLCPSASFTAPALYAGEECATIAGPFTPTNPLANTDTCDTYTLNYAPYTGKCSNLAATTYTLTIKDTDKGYRLASGTYCRTEYKTCKTNGYIPGPAAGATPSLNTGTCSLTIKYSTQKDACGIDMSTIPDTVLALDNACTKVVVPTP